MDKKNCYLQFQRSLKHVAEFLKGHFQTDLFGSYSIWVPSIKNYSLSRFAYIFLHLHYYKMNTLLIKCYIAEKYKHFY